MTTDKRMRLLALRGAVKAVDDVLSVCMFKDARAGDLDRCLEDLQDMAIEMQRYHELGHVFYDPRAGLTDEAAQPEAKE